MPLQANIFLLVLRGYYYEADTKLYYLKTRYYAPEAGRFVSQDGIEYLNGGTIAGITSYNAGARGWDLFGAIAEWFLTGAVIGGIIGGLIAAFIYAAPAIGPFLGSSFQIGSYLTAAGELVAVTVTGAQIAAAGLAALAGMGIMFSKHRPGMTNKPPFSWVTQEEGIESMLQNNLDANKAADQIMNNHVDGWKRGAGQDHNVIKKWLDRIIRKLIKK